MEITRTPDMIAGEINAIKTQVRSTALLASVEIGKRLQEAKGLVPSGAWTEWLENNVAYSPRTAQNLMALAAEFAAGHAEALAELSYTKAVMLLALPQDEREDFVEQHDVEGMSSRELRQALRELQQKNEEMQITMDQLIQEKNDSAVDALKEQVATLNADLEKQKSAVETARDVNRAAKATEKELREKITAAERKLKDTEAAAEQERRQLQQALSEAKQPIIQQVTPPDVERELEELRGKLQRSQEEQALRAGYDLLRSSYTRLNRQLSDLETREPALAAQFRGAFARGLRLMAEGLEGKEAEGA